jgi:uncharacterized protein
MTTQKSQSLTAHSVLHLATTSHQGGALAAQTPKTSSKPRGFAKMTLEQRQSIASLGGKAAHANGNAYKFTSEAARIAGRKGGRVSRRGPKVVRPQ